MKNIICSVVSTVILLAAHPALAEKKAITFTHPKHGQTVSNPVEVCMKATGVVIEPVSNGVNTGRGHLHLLIDYPLPADLKKPLPLDIPEQVIHLGDGSNCRTLNLTPGRHSLRALLADGSHTPGVPHLTKLIDIKVK